MSYYTGRYPSSHGTTWNRVPLSVSEVTLGEHLAGRERDMVLIGKSHVIPDQAGMQRLAIDGGSELGTLLARGSFREADRYDGHHEPGDESGYPAFLRRHGYDSPDPWSDYVISAVDANGQVVSGWHMRNAHLPARVLEPHSETAYTTDCALDFMRKRGSQPWALHLSYVKPHWPYMAPDPYHRMYRSDQCLPVVRNQQELAGAHPVLQAYRQHEESQSFAREECVRTVRPVYQGLITQLDTHLGRLFDYMEGAGLMRNTLVVFTSDHGDFLGDHWLGEKELFYDTVQRVPLIIMDPSAAAEGTRGQVCRQLVESVDITPTILQALDVPQAGHLLEGRALQPLLHGAPEGMPWRVAAVSELDYSFRQARLTLRKTPQQCRAWSVRTDRWRYVYWRDEPEQLFDLQSDPNEFEDLGASESHAAVRAEMRQHLLDWSLRSKRRTTMSDEAVERYTNAHKRAGIYFGQW